MAPNVVYIVTPDGLGSGVILEDGTILTNAHVVGLYPTVEVTVPGELPVTDVKVKSLDRVADLAILEPVRTSAPGLSIADRLPTAGETVYTLGYPGGYDIEAEPSIQSTVVSRHRRSQLLDLTYLQVDDPVSAGNSGGPLVDANGRIAGIVTFSYTESGFGLALGVPRLDLPTAYATDPADVIDPGAAETNLVVTIEQGRSQSWVVQVDERHRDIAIELTGGTDAGVSVTTLNGFDPSALPAEVDFVDFDGWTDEARWISPPVDNKPVSAETEVGLPGRYLVTAWSGEETGDVELQSSHRLIPFADPEDGTEISVNGSQVGAIDHAGDTDTYSIELLAGTTVGIEVASLVDMAATLRLNGEVIASNDDSGFGVFGSDALLFAEIATTGVYELEVASFFEAGGYVVDVWD